MSSVFSEGFESGSNGVTITTSNTTYSAASGTSSFDNSTYVAGSLSAKMSPGGGAGIYLREIFSGGSVTSRYFRRYFQVNAFPGSTSIVTLLRVRLSSTNLGQVVLLNTGAIQIRDANTTIATSSNTISLNTWFRIEWEVNGTGAATQTCRLFLGSNSSGATPTETLTGGYSGGAFDRIEDGVGTSGYSGTLWLDEVDDDTSSWPGPSSGASQPPTANAGTNQTVVSGQVVTLNGSASSDTSGTIISYSWSQLTGTSVTLSNPTAVSPSFTSPTVTTSPITLSFGLVVTDNHSLQSSQSSVTITVDPPAATAFSEDFEDGTAGGLITTSNSSYNSIAGTPTFDASTVVY